MSLLEQFGAKKSAQRIRVALVAVNGSTARSLRVLGLEARRRGDHAGAFEHFQAAVSLGCTEPPLLQELGAAALAIGRVEEAEEAYRSALLGQPDLVDAIRGLGHCARRRGDRTVALAQFERAGELSDNPRIGFEVATERLALGEEPSSAYRALILGDATRSQACLEVARHLSRSGAVKHARSWLESAVAADPENLAARRELASLLSRLWDLDRAASIYRDLLATEPGDVAALLGLAALEKRQGRREHARSLFETAWRADPDRGAVELARDCREHGEHARARDLLVECLARHPGDASVHVQLGLVARAAGAPAMAVRHFEDAIAIDARHPSAHIELAADLLRLGRFPEATCVLDRAVALWPDQARVLEALGDAAAAAENYVQASHFHERAAACDPGQPSPRMKLARCRAALGQTDRAIAALDLLVETLGPSPDAAVARAQIFKDRGMLAEASATFREASTAFPRDVHLWLQSALFHAERSREDGPDASRGEELAGTPAERSKTGIVRGARAAARWDFAEAQACFEQAIENNPNDGAIRFRLAQAALANLDLAAAEDHLRHLSRQQAPIKRLRGEATGPFQSLLGQILDEVRLDASALSRFRAAASTSPNDRLGPLLAAVRNSPGVTLASMQVLIELRRRGLLGAAASCHAGAPSPIPKVIVQFWHAEELPADVLALCETWQHLNPDWSYRRFNETTASAFLATESEAHVTQAFRRARDPAAKADIFRLAYLARRGGLYVDADDRCLAPLRELVANGSALIAYQEDIGSVGNDVIAAAPSHPVILRALEGACAAVAGSDNDIAWLSTGPGLLSRVLGQRIVENGAACLTEDRVGILERRSLLAYVATGCTTAYKHTRRHWSRAAFTADKRPSGGTALVPLRRPISKTRGGLRDERGPAYDTA